MKYISVDDFIKQVDGHAFDMDKAYGVQCVDGIKKFVDMVYGESNFTCGNGWANGLWLNFKNNGCNKYFVQKPFSEAKKGDWIIWDKGSKSAPSSHVGMFIKNVSNSVVTVFGQSQGGKKEFNYLDTFTDGILGVLRPKIYENINEDKPTKEEPKKEVIYYPKTPYTGVSIVDGLKAIKVDSSYAHRSLIAKANNITNYRGTPEQNTKMLNLLKEGKLIKE